MEDRLFYVKMVAVGGKFPGMRGATYKAANACRGYRLREQEHPIYYSNGDIHMDVYFLDDAKGVAFIDTVKKVHNLPELVSHNPTFAYTLTVVNISALKLLYIFEDDYTVTPPGSVDFDAVFENRVQDLGYLSKTGHANKKRKGSSAASVSGRSSSRLSTAFEYQSFEKPIRDETMFSCHLFSRKYAPESLERNPNNFVCGYYDFHNGLDGLTTNLKVPRFALEFVKVEGVEGDVTDCDGEVRKKVWVRICFLDAKTASEWLPKFMQSFKSGSIPGQISHSIESFVHVTDAVEFQNMLALKNTLTKNVWRTRGLSK